MNQETGELVAPSEGPLSDLQFTGTVAEWYGLLVETLTSLGIRLMPHIGQQPISDDELQLVSPHTLDSPIMGRLYVSPDVMTILECSVIWEPHIEFGKDDRPKQDSYVWGTISNRYNVYKSLGVDRNEVILELNNGRVGKVVIHHMTII